MDKLFRIDNSVSIRLNRLFKARLSVFNSRSVLYRFVKRSSKQFLPRESNPKIEGRNGHIWLFWAQGFEKMPSVVKSCYASVLRNKGELEVHLVDMKSCRELVDIPDYIYDKVEKGQISLTHFSDILRFNLLKKYGGFWLDATIYVTSEIKIPESLYSIRLNVDSAYISEARWCGFSWYLPMGHPMATFLVEYLNYYWKRYDILIDYLLIDYVLRVLYDSNSKFREEIDALTIENPDLYFFQSPKCEEQLDLDKWRVLMKNNQFFKTTYKVGRAMEQCGAPTYWGHLLQC